MNFGVYKKSTFQYNVLTYNDYGPSVFDNHLHFQKKSIILGRYSLLDHMQQWLQLLLQVFVFLEPKIIII